MSCNTVAAGLANHDGVEDEVAQHQTTLSYYNVGTSPGARPVGMA